MLMMLTATVLKDKFCAVLSQCHTQMHCHGHDRGNASDFACRGHDRDFAAVMTVAMSRSRKKGR